jgi:hypothetical protein
MNENVHFIKCYVNTFMVQWRIDCTHQRLKMTFRGWPPSPSLQRIAVSGNSLIGVLHLLPKLCCCGYQNGVHKDGS